MSNESSNGSASSRNVVLIVVGIVVGVLALTCVGVVVVGTAIMGPALDQARGAALALRSATQLRQIEISIEVAARDEAGPVGSIEELIERGYITTDLAASPAGPVGDGRGDYWVLFDRSEVDEVDDPGSFIVSYDRSMYALGGKVAACTLDTNCTAHEFAEFEALLAAPVNEGRDFDLPSP